MNIKKDIKNCCINIIIDFVFISLFFLDILSIFILPFVICQGMNNDIRLNIIWVAIIEILNIKFAFVILTEINKTIEKIKEGEK